MHKTAVTAILFCAATVALGQTVHHVNQMNCTGPGSGTPGDLSALVDNDGDGLPDAGHGVCANALDPDTSDTEFQDFTVPDPADGFFYLMGTVDDDGAEVHLGMTNAGLPRQPGLPCP